MSVANEKIDATSASLRQAEKDLQKRTQELATMTEKFNKKDKEALSLGLKRDELEALTRQQKDTNLNLERDNGHLKKTKEELLISVENLRGQIDHLEKIKAKLEDDLRTMAVKLAKEKNKKLELRQEKKDLKKEIMELQETIESRDAAIRKLQEEKAQQSDIIREEKLVIEDQKSHILTLKAKLEDC